MPAVTRVQEACASLIESRKKWRLMYTTTAPSFLMALHPKGELVSDTVQEHGSFDSSGGARMLRHIAPFPGHVVLDCGANIGSLALLFAAAGYETHAFEPQSANFELIDCSSRLNGFYSKNLFLYNQAVGSDSNSFVCLDPIEQNMGSSTVSTHPKDNCKRTSVVTLDEFVMSRPAFQNRIALLKIDVEGFEPSLLSGAQRMLGSSHFQPKFVAIEMSCARWKSRFSKECAEVFSLITRNGYRLIFPEAAVYNLTQFIQDNFNGVPDLLFEKT